MSTILPAYDALPSDIASTTPALGQTDSRLPVRRNKLEASMVSPTASPLRRTCLSPFWKSWEWEFAACLLSLAIPIIIFATLYPYSGKPLPQWPFKVSINSLLSIYAVALKASIGFTLSLCIGQLQWAWFSTKTRPLTDMYLFDGATRGVDGAVSLIWRQRFQQPLTALGCFIMLLAVTIDPFVQQLIRPIDCSIAVSDGSAVATLPRANLFKDYGFSTDYNRTLSENDGNDMGQDMENLLYGAVFHPGQDPPWQCSTGNCTFQDTYGTIGICYSCRDSSADVVITTTCSPSDSSYTSQNPTSVEDCPANANFTIESSIPFGKYDLVYARTKMMRAANGVIEVADVADASADLEPLDSDFGDARRLLFTFLLGATADARGRTDWTTFGDSACDANNSKQSWACQGYGAATCSLQHCVQLYNATISAGVLKEHLVTSSSETEWGTLSAPDGTPLYIALVDTHCSVGNRTFPDRQQNARSRWEPYNFSLTEKDVQRNAYGELIGLSLPEDVKSLLSSECLYLISAGFMLYSLLLNLGGVVEAFGVQTSKQGQDSRIETILSFMGPQLVRSIYNWGHTDLKRVEGIIANISNSLTTYIRTHGGNPEVMGSTYLPGYVQGKVYHYATCLQVDWAWLSFPASLAIFTTIFCFMVVGATKKHGNPAWKVSPLAWIFRVDAPGNASSWSSTRTCEGMKERSGHTAVHILGQDVDGPRILMSDVKDPNLSLG